MKWKEKEGVTIRYNSVKAREKATEKVTDTKEKSQDE